MAHYWQHYTADIGQYRADAGVRSLAPLAAVHALIGPMLGRCRSQHRGEISVRHLLYFPAPPPPPLTSKQNCCPPPPLQHTFFS